MELDKDRIENYYKGEYTPQDETYINQVFTDEHQVKALRGLLSAQFRELFEQKEEIPVNLDHILHKIHYDINMRARRRNPRLLGTVARWALSAAGAVLLPVVIFWGIKNHQETTLPEESWVEIMAPAWTRAQFSLPDGTTGWLNSNSSIKYQADFIHDRQVTLSGEAFFDVANDNRKPFAVCMPEATVTVLGTRFNIASYDNEKTVEVVLEEGKLSFTDNSTSQSVTMNTNDLVVLDKARRSFSGEVVNPMKYTSWTDGKLVFRNDPLDVIARRLERWYNIEVELNVTGHEDIRWRATFQDDNLEEVLRLLQRSLHIDYRIVNGVMSQDDTVSKKKVILFSRKK